MMTRIGTAVALLGIGACALPEEELSSTEQHGTHCSPAVCGLNSPRIDYQGFHELEKHGVENDQGLAITLFEQGGTPYTFDVTNNALIARRRGVRLEHQALIGAQFHISLNGRDEWLIRVAGVSSMPIFIAPFAAGQPTDVETYVLEYSRPQPGEPTRWTNVCGGTWAPEDDTHGDTNTETFNQPPMESILFDLDRIDIGTMTVNDVPDSSWFNIGCSGHTLSKLFLTRNMMASQGGAPGLHDTRQATLKMLTADYFGDGTPFTVAGQKLAWQGGGMTYFGTLGPLEARWSSSGAICLTTPRMLQPSTAEGALTFPDIEAALYQHELWTGVRRPRPCRSNSTAAVLGEARTSVLRN